jgi:hypothetical protein
MAPDRLVTNAREALVTIAAWDLRRVDELRAAVDRVELVEGTDSRPSSWADALTSLEAYAQDLASLERGPAERADVERAWLSTLFLRTEPFAALLTERAG